MNYRKINNLTGWAVFAVAIVTYLMTMAPTASYWDCGEFIACSNELEVPHPPGAPFYLLIGRIFAMFAGNNVSHIAWFLNLFSALSSAFTVLFTVWITTYLTRRLVASQTEEPNFTQTLVIMVSGAVAGLVTTFADSFWFNSVEAEVYALSSFFTAIVVWLMFKWEERADEAGSERWIILIAYLMGLSIGVHLLNLLTVPALALIYYFRKYPYSLGGLALTGLISIAILGVIQTGIILYTFDIAWFFEKTLVGTIYPNGSPKSGLGLPIGSGIILFFFILFGIIGGAIFVTAKRKMLTANMLLVCSLVIYIGFSTYLMIPIRSSANPPIDENNPENTSSFLSYMKREQYGNRPLFKGPLYNADPIALDVTGKEYVLDPGGSRYVELGDKFEYKYADRDMKIFPRMYERSKYTSGPFGYVNFVRSKGADATNPADDKPTASEDLSFFLQYQVVHMYWRYFMWNFAGKEGDFQDQDWESGLRFDQTSKMPDSVKDWPAKNHYFLLPFLLGILGLAFQVGKNKGDALIIGLLFFFTGLAIIIYLNQYPSQPRERDYSFAGSFQTFAIWVGIGVGAIYYWLQKYLKESGAYVAIAVGLITPAIMAAQNWDDHSRANNYLAPDSAYNLLNSLEKDAVLFTNGDNDTFPLWYIQEVEGVRTDVRVLCLSYVNTDWYIDQMYKQYNESPALPLTLDKKKYQGQANQSRNMGSRAAIDLQLPVDAATLIANGIISAADSAYLATPMAWKVSTRGGGSNHYFELKDVLILDLLSNVAKEGWKRPIYFANTVAPNSFLNLNTYLRLEGLAYRVLPVSKPSTNDPYDPYDGYIDLARTDSSLTSKFKYTNLDDASVYYDENAMRMISNYYNTFYRLANAYLRAASDSDLVGDSIRSASYRQRAEAVMNYGEEKFPISVATPDPYMIVRTGLMYDRLDQKEKAQKYYDAGEKMAYETLNYYQSINESFVKGREYYISLNLLMQQYQQTGRAEKLDELRQKMSNLRQPEI